jgi:hypothetical protein
MSRRAGVWAVVITLIAGSVTSQALATPPPADFALQAVGEEAEDRREGRWQLAIVDDGVKNLCGAVDDERARFSDEESTLEVGTEADEPWNLLWAVMWSDEPHRALAGVHGDWADQTARFIVVDDEPVQCWGRESKLCVDRLARRVAVLEVDVDGVRWAFRMSRGGERVQITRNGSQFGRLALGGC